MIHMCAFSTTMHTFILQYKYPDILQSSLAYRLLATTHVSWSAKLLTEKY